MPDQTPGRRPIGSGEDGQFVHTRKPTIDDRDDIYDEGGVLEDELEAPNNDIQPHVRTTDDLDDEPEAASLGAEATRLDSLRREDRGAVNLDPEDLESADGADGR